MSEHVIIHGLAISNYVRSALICCEEKGIPYTLCEERPQSAEILALNPLGKIPVLEHGDTILFETAAIGHYIDRQFSGPSLIPQPTLEQIRMEQWVSVVNTAIDPVVMRRCVIQYAFPSGPNGQIDQEKIDAAIPEIQKLLGILDTRLADSPYLAGATMSIADILLLPMIDYLATVPPGGSLLSEATAVHDWQSRMSRRPACARILTRQG